MGNVTVAGPSTLVATGGALHRPGGDGRWWSVNGREHVGELVDQAQGADVVLMHSSSLEWWGLPREIGKTPLLQRPFFAGAVKAGWEVEPADGVTWRAAVRPQNGGRWTTVVLLPYDEERICGPWGELDRWQDLVRGLTRFQLTAGGQAWRDSIGRTVERLILNTHPREHGGTLLERNPQVPAPALDGGLEQPLVWRRQLLDGERYAGHVHAYDANAQYLAAWQAVELGVGDPHQLGPCEFSGKEPGLWRLEGVQLDADGWAGPVPWDVRREWFTTPTVIRMQELGVQFSVLEAYVWPRHSRWLRGAGEILRDARAQLINEQGDVAGRAALAAVKACYRVQTGRLNMAARDERSGWRRPDWGHAIRATARVNLHRRLMKLSATPFAIATDGLLFVSEVDDGHAFAEQIGLPIGSRLGEYSYEGGAKLSPERVDELEAATSAPATYKVLRSWGPA